MAHSQLPPRQRMINMMYLVLTAILALTVSTEVLDAFKGVNDSIGASNSSLQNKTSNLFADFQKQNANDSLRAKEAFSKAQKAHELSQQLYSLLEQYKQQLIKGAGGIDPETGKIVRDDDIDVATRLFVENDGKDGKKLKEQIVATRTALLNLLEPAEREEFQKNLSLQIVEPTDGRAWEYASFNHVPAIAAVTNLSKYQNDVLTAEQHIVEQLYTSIYARTMKVDKMEAKVISPSSYIMQGETYKADVLVAASNATLVPEVFIGSFTPQVRKNIDGTYDALKSDKDVLPLNAPVKVDVESNTGRLQLPANAVGNKKYTGIVRIKGTDGMYNFYPFEGEYQVAPKTAVVSASKMNVVYVGLDNPIDLSVPGVAQTDIVPAVEGDAQLINAGDGTFTLKVNSNNQKKVKIKVGAKVNGKVLAMGEKEFRVKRVPNPELSLDGISLPGNISATLLKQRTGVVANMNDFFYDGVRWTILSYTATLRKGPDIIPLENTGPLFSEKTKGVIKTLKKGDALFIDNVVARGPGGQRTLPSIAFNITAQ